MRAIKANPNVMSVFKQAVLLVATDVWIKECPRDVSREDYYCYLRFDTEDACAESVKAKAPAAIYAVERIAEPNDVFQYRNAAGEMELYIRPKGTASFYGLDLTDCADDKAAFAKFVEAMPDESAVMASLAEEQDHVIVNFSPSSNYEKRFSIALFRDGNAYCYEDPSIGAPDPDREASRLAELEALLGELDDESLISDMTRAVQSCNLWKSQKRTKAPVESRGQRGFFADYSVYNREPVEYAYEPDDLAREEYRAKGLCSYCGCAFEASLIKKCRICGKKKDY